MIKVLFPVLTLFVFHFRNYLDRLAEEVNDKLQEEGHVTIPELTKLYDLPGDYLAEVNILLSLCMKFFLLIFQFI